MRRRLLELTLMSALVFVVPSARAATRLQPADGEPSEVSTVWFDTLYDVVESEAIAFPEAGRIYGISAVALYEAVVPGTLHHRSLVGQLHDLNAILQLDESEPYHWPTVANAALAHTIRGLLPSLKPENLDAIDTLEQHFAAQFQEEVPPEDEARSVAHGQAVADAILAWAATGWVCSLQQLPVRPRARARRLGADAARLHREPAAALLGQLRPMVLTSGEECAPPGHPGVLQRS